jgi:hypothetical protein
VFRYEEFKPGEWKLVGEVTGNERDNRASGTDAEKQSEGKQSDKRVD